MGIISVYGHYIRPVFIILDSQIVECQCLNCFFSVLTCVPDYVGFSFLLAYHIPAFEHVKHKT